MLQIIAGSWPIAVMFIATLAALIALRIMRMAEKARKENIEYRASHAVAVRHSDNAGMILIALCATSLLLSAAGVAIAADKPVPFAIGATPIGHKDTPALRRLIAECNKDVPANETPKQFERRLNLPCPGRLE